MKFKKMAVVRLRIFVFCIHLNGGTNIHYKVVYSVFKGIATRHYRPHDGTIAANKGDTQLPREFVGLRD